MSSSLPIWLSWGKDIPTIYLLLLVGLLLLLFEYNKSISPFVARKMTHLSMGLLLLLLLLPETQRDTSFPVRGFVAFVAVSSILLCFIRPFRFGRYGDKGIIVFNLLVLFFLFYDLDFGYLAPAFIADPLGALVGKTLNTPRWIGRKTIGGSIAVFIGCFVSCFRIEGLIPQLGLAAGSCLLEATTGELDNLFMNIPIFAYYWANYTAKQHGLVFRG